jgi:hypothetical protein
MFRRGDKACLLLVLSTKPDLMIPQETIHECHHLTTYGGIDDFVNSREGEVVFGAALV